VDLASVTRKFGRIKMVIAFRALKIRFTAKWHLQSQNHVSF